MIKIRISGFSNSKRNVWLTLPTTEEQINQAFDKLLKGVPIGKTFAYHITSNRHRADAVSISISQFQKCKPAAY